jgi:ferritin
MVEQAEKEKDHGTRSMLNWFVDEQVEEEEHATEILARLKNSGNSPIACQMLDRDLGNR